MNPSFRSALLGTCGYGPLAVLHLQDLVAKSIRWTPEGFIALKRAARLR